MEASKRYLGRHIETAIIEKLKPNKAILLIGARRVGKTELINHIRSKINSDSILLYGGDDETLALLNEKSTANYRRVLGNKTLLIIDEAQEIPNIGAKLKLILDTIEGIRIIATGSSAFDLTEPLVGRKSTFNLYPFAQMEFSEEENFVETKSNLKERLVLGSYPELIHLTTLNEKIDYLKEVVN